ncbi:unnamed protein product [Prorocentrum cordatum]|uniref:Thioredoxin domain-containing protein n=1 Tax=Prorocentrum cordatum TaxID=2364126 RepID=A0ABN9W4E9_9DINO|nr:unnamed protein product [Polarella glacialis]
MWSKALVKHAEMVFQSLSPNTPLPQIRAASNTTHARLIFNDSAAAKAILEESIRAGPRITLGSESVPLSLQWDRSPDKRVWGWMISQLWKKLEQHMASKGIQGQVGCRRGKGEVFIDIGGMGQLITIYTVLDGELSCPGLASGKAGPGIATWHDRTAAAAVLRFGSRWEAWARRPPAGASRPRPCGVDAYRTVSADLTRGTTLGGLLTVVAYAVIAVVLVAELRDVVRPDRSTRVVIDRDRDEAMRIEFNISLFDLPCKYLKLGAWDKYGKDRVISNGSFEYFPLGSTGDVVGSAYTAEEIALLEQADVAADLTDAEIAEVDADWSSSSDHFKHQDFWAAVTFHDFTLVNFYAEWCVHCRQFHPMWMEATRRISENLHFTDGSGRSSTVKFLKVNCVDFGEHCTAARIQSFPTLRLYKRDGTFEAFQQHRTIENIISFLTASVRKSHMITAQHHTIFREGCRVAGHIDVPRLPGAFHLQAEPFAAGLELNPALTNVSHMVNHLAFCSTERSCGVGWLRSVTGIPFNMKLHVMPMNAKAFTVQHFHEAPEHYMKAMSVKLKDEPVIYQVTHTSRTRRLANKSVVPKARHGGRCTTSRP